MTRDARIGIAILVALGALVFGLLVVSSLARPGASAELLGVDQVRAGSPADRYGSAELHVAGWYASLDADCVDPAPLASSAVPWLEETCPLRVLMPQQPDLAVTQAELEAGGLRLAAPNGKPFPSRAQPGGPNLRLQQLVFVGHFDDPAAQQCAPERVLACRDTFVVTTYEGLLR